MVAHHGILTTLLFEPASEFSSSDTVIVGQEIWDEICTRDLAAESERIPICLTSLDNARCAILHSSQSPVSSLVCWAELRTKHQGTSLPYEWMTQYKRIFNPACCLTGSQPTHLISPVQLCVLSEVILQAESSYSYTVASKGPGALEEWAVRGQRILRQQSVYELDPSLFASNLHSWSSPLVAKLKFRVVMTTPVLQGCARSSTRFVLLPPRDDKLVVNGQGHPHLSGISTPASDGMSIDGNIEIDESFLVGPSSTFFSREAYAPNGQHPQRPSRFPAEPLARIINPFLDDHTVYVRTSDLSKLGILNADWAILRPESTQPYRAVRVQADDSVVPDSGKLYASPVLLHNIFPVSDSRRTVLELQPLPDALRGQMLPTARSVTVARVASQISINRLYQALVMQALMSYMRSEKRLIRQGDLLAIKVNIQQEHTSNALSDEALEGISPEYYDHPIRHHEHLVYFVVTSVDTQPQRNNFGDARPPDLSVALTVGELGCWVDALETRVVQTGVEHSFVPDMATYMGLSVVYELDDSVRNNGVAYERLHGLISAALVPQALSYDMPLSIALKGARGVGKSTMAETLSRKLGMHTYKLDCYDLLGDSDAKTEGIVRARFDQATSCSPCVLILQNIDAFAQTTQNAEPSSEPTIVSVLKDLLHDMSGSWRLSGYPIIVLCTMSEAGRTPPSLLACFKHEVEFHTPDENERASILRSSLCAQVVGPDVDITDIARKTAAFVAGDIAALVSRAEMKAIMRAVSTDFSPRDAMLAGVALIGSDFASALEDARSSYSQSIGAPNIPSVSWDDVGGLSDVKADILDTIQLPLERPELFSENLKKRSGILLYGPPGTGKTLLAKAVATSFSLNFFSVKGPELLNMYIGESEANVRRVFQRARDARPCVVFFDELDSVAPKRGAFGDSGGVMDRIVSQLLAELDGIAAGSGGDVFVIGATNRPDLLDPALLRPGRFDRMLYLGVSDTKSAQLKVLQALTRKFRLDPALDLSTVVEECSFNFTGADFYALCTDALLKAMTRKAEEIDAKIATLNGTLVPGRHPLPITPQYYLAEMATPSDVLVTVSYADFDRALRALTPSVSQAEMEHYLRIQRRFSHGGE